MAAPIFGSRYEDHERGQHGARVRAHGAPQNTPKTRLTDPTDLADRQDWREIQGGSGLQDILIQKGVSG